MMGRFDGESDERPPHSKTVSSFMMLPCEVTESQYDSCVAVGRCTQAHYADGQCRQWNGSAFVKAYVPAAARGGTNPVVCVTWHQAQQYCGFRGMQLPSEVQWEYAARGGSEGRYPWGNAPASAGRMVISGTGGPRPVGSCAPNGFGLYDMTGNVWEWVRDTYAPDTYMNDTAGNVSGFYRVIRGGGWNSTPGQATVFNREWFAPDFGEVSIGFRCVAPR
jgi:formylglycine-generating enzyme required for sulfatase activity